MSISANTCNDGHPHHFYVDYQSDADIRCAKCSSLKKILDKLPGAMGQNTFTDAAQKIAKELEAAEKQLIAVQNQSASRSHVRAMSTKDLEKSINEIQTSPAKNNRWQYLLELQEEMLERLRNKMAKKKSTKSQVKRLNNAIRDLLDHQYKKVRDLGIAVDVDNVNDFRFRSPSTTAEQEMVLGGQIAILWFLRGMTEEIESGKVEIGGVLFDEIEDTPDAPAIDPSVLDAAFAGMKARLEGKIDAAFSHSRERSNQ